MKNVEFMPLAREVEELRPKLDGAYHRVMDSACFIMGPELEAFESEFAKFCGVEYAIGVGNGLDALQLSLQAYGIGPDDEVIVPAFTFIATWLAVTQSGAKIVPVDVEYDTANIDVSLIEKEITPKTKAIMPVHLYGQPADMSEINALAKKYNLFVLEDAAQAHGAHYNGDFTGNLGDAAGFSFYPAKNMGAFGDGGAVTTNCPKLAKKLKMIRNYGASEKYIHKIHGVNSRLDEIQAAFLREKIKHLKRFTQRRQEIADIYNNELGGLNIELPKHKNDKTHAWHLYTIKVEGRDALMQKMEASGVKTLIHYPVSPHLQSAYQSMNFKPSDFPVAKKISDKILSLPMHSHLNNEEIEMVCRVLKACL